MVIPAEGGELLVAVHGLAPTEATEVLVEQVDGEDIPFELYDVDSGSIDGQAFVGLVTVTSLAEPIDVTALGHDGEPLDGWPQETRLGFGSNG